MPGNKKDIKELVKKFDFKVIKDFNIYGDIGTDYENEYFNLRLENPTRKCKFYSVYLKLKDVNNFKYIKQYGNMNEGSNKINRYPYNKLELYMILSDFHKSLENGQNAA